VRRIPSLRIYLHAPSRLMRLQRHSKWSPATQNATAISTFLSACLLTRRRERERAFHAPLSNGTFACRQRIFISVNIASLWCHWIAHIAPVVCLLRQVTSSNGCKILFACAPSPKRFLFWRLARLRRL
jgi:hypothetical protein